MPSTTVTSTDAPAPAGGPGFLRLSSWPYRLEYAAATLLILGLLFVWRLGILHALPPGVIALTVFWMLWPDLLAFVPIGIVARGSRNWPSWGAVLYDLPHSLLVWAGVFAVWSVLAGGIEWPLLGWAAHITADRAFGFYLRAPSGTGDRGGPTATVGEAHGQPPALR